MKHKAHFILGVECLLSVNLGSEFRKQLWNYVVRWWNFFLVEFRLTALSVTIFCVLIFVASNKRCWFGTTPLVENYGIKQ